MKKIFFLVVILTLSLACHAQERKYSTLSQIDPVLVRPGTRSHKLFVIIPACFIV